MKKLEGFYTAEQAAYEFELIAADVRRNGGLVRWDITLETLPEPVQVAG